ncbi:protein CutA homolog [Acropora muricata]|uniref:protein CutA homolog n=1 Tax=Acropora millepora TaxID=45264 RepID=UPI001CF56F79|nr:protein CutA homolog [Acropora millepora]
MFVLRGLFVASLAGYWRLFPRRFLMAASSSDGEYSSAFVTCPNTDVAKKIARGLVQKKIAACVNIIPGITSIYTWEDKVEEDAEVLMMIKTRTNRLGDLTDYVRKEHPYDVPEVISVKLGEGNPAYLQWIRDTVPDK